MVCYSLIAPSTYLFNKTFTTTTTLMCTIAMSKFKLIVSVHSKLKGYDVGWIGLGIGIGLGTGE